MALRLQIALMLITSFGLTGCGDNLVSHFAFVPMKASGLDRVPQDPRVSETWITAADGTRLHAFLVDHPAPRRDLLYLHGNAGHALHRLPDVRRLSDVAEARVLLLDYRGYGHSEGRATEAGVYQDAEAAWQWMRAQWNSEPGRSVVIGRSLGSAVTIDLVSRHPVAGIVLISPFESGLAMASAMGLGLFKGLVDQPFDSIGKVVTLRMPALFIHGEHDGIVPPAQGRRLFDAYGGGDKRFLEADGAGHNDIVDVMGDDYFSVIAQFAARVAP